MTSANELLARITVPKTPPCRRASILLEGQPGTGKTYNAFRLEGKTLGIYTDSNRATLDMLKAQGHDIHEVEIKNWKEDFDPFLLVKLKNRELDFDNIVVDSIDALFELWITEKQQRVKKFSHDEWAELLGIQTRVTYELTNLCRPRQGQRDYNFVATCKIQDTKDDQGIIFKYEPMILGSFRGKIEAKFDYVLQTDSEMVSEQVAGGKRERRKNLFIRTVPGDNYHSTKAPIHWPAKVGSLKDIHDLIDSDLQNAK